MRVTLLLVEVSCVSLTGLTCFVHELNESAEFNKCSDFGRLFAVSSSTYCAFGLSCSLLMVLCTNVILIIQNHECELDSVSGFKSTVRLVYSTCAKLVLQPEFDLYLNKTTMNIITVHVFVCTFIIKTTKR